MPEIKDLPACPFCGGAAWRPKLLESEGFAVRCYKCDAETFGLTQEEADANWIMRAIPLATQKILLAAQNAHWHNNSEQCIMRASLRDIQNFLKEWQSMKERT